MAALKHMTISLFKMNCSKVGPTALNSTVDSEIDLLNM